MRRGIFCLLFLASAFGSVLPAFANIPIAYYGFHKWSDPSGKLFIYHGQMTAGSTLEVAVPKAPRSRSLSLNPCGWARISNPNRLIYGVASSAVPLSWSSRVTSGSPPTCDSSGIPVSSPNSPVGSVLVEGTSIWVRLATNSNLGVPISVDIQEEGVISFRSNACGFARVAAVSSTRTISSMGIGERGIGDFNVSVASLPSVPKPLVCRKVGIDSVLYVPLSF